MIGPTAAVPGRVEAWPPEPVPAVRAARPGRYRLLVEIGADLGLRQGEALGLSLDDIDFAKKVVYVRCQVKMMRAKMCFALPKGRKARYVPLPSSVARGIQWYMGLFARVPFTLPWDDPRAPAQGQGLSEVPRCRRSPSRPASPQAGRVRWPPPLKCPGRDQRGA
ncbi:tyrosine-type recombinase/integrase [Streptomyces celluloflavus]|uniref:tyrosine-type recombinase/integrase n=1 Tax=Streptomyces celluloflavus TaxID=58344 RepID=UPI0037B484CD